MEQGSRLKRSKPALMSVRAGNVAPTACVMLPAGVMILAAAGGELKLNAKEEFPPFAARIWFLWTAESVCWRDKMIDGSGATWRLTGVASAALAARRAVRRVWVSIFRSDGDV